MNRLNQGDKQSLQKIVKIRILKYIFYSRDSHLFLVPLKPITVLKTHP